MSRELYLLVQRSHPFPAHWALWIPRVSNPKSGKIISVRGNSMSGFNLEFERCYSLEDIPGVYSTILVAEVNASSIVDGPEDVESKDDKASDVLEEMAILVPAPTKSLRPAWGKSAKTRVELKNCQTWMIEYISKLVEAGIVPQEGLEVVKAAPKN